MTHEKNAIMITIWLGVLALIFLFSYLLVFIMNKIPISWIKKSVV